jgi:hypothetical protein
MFSFLKSKSKPDAARFGNLIFIIAVSPDDLPRYADELYAEVRPYVRIDLTRFRNEYVFLRLFAADYALAVGASHNPEVQDVRNAYMARVGEWLRLLDSPEAPYDLQKRFDRYGEAVNRGRGSPFIAAANDFLEFCHRTNHTGAGRGVLAVQSDFVIISQAVTEAMTSWGF